jgi:hypothetical protein
MVTQDRVKELLEYDPETGVFVWLISASNAVPKGTVAGTRKANGYSEIKIDWRLYKAHRLAWLYTHGEFPDSFIDHINGDRSDNRISNLRLATKSENGQNQKTARPDNKSGYLGVHWCNREQRWVAQIALHGKKHFCGYFSDPADAHAAYLAKKKEIHIFQPTPR